MSRQSAQPTQADTSGQTVHHLQHSHTHTRMLCCQHIHQELDSWAHKAPPDIYRSSIRCGPARDPFTVIPRYSEREVTGLPHNDVTLKLKPQTQLWAPGIFPVSTIPRQSHEQHFSNCDGDTVTACHKQSPPAPAAAHHAASCT